MIRILLIEDDERRYTKFKEWLPEAFHVVWAKNAGAALGILERLQPGDYAGILLDHDLEKRTMTDDGAHFNGGHVVDALLKRRPTERDIPILVHSMNANRGPGMAHRLAEAGYPVTRVRMAELCRERFLEWLEELREE